MPMKQHVFIETYGCQMNVYDSELVKTILTNDGYTCVSEIDQANIVLLNTCSVRDNANRKVYNRVHEIKRAKNNNVLIGVLGCMATNFKTDLLENNRLHIDFIAGPDSYKQLPTLIHEAAQNGKKSFDVTLSEYETYSDVMPTRQDGVNAWIAIMRGCNNFCTFCVVPYTRGRERSRDPLNIIEEVKHLVSQGYKQVTLLGQNVNSYHFDRYDFTDLMAMVSDVEGLKRVRFTSPHPKDFPIKLLKLMSKRDNLCKSVHMPLQAGNNRILEKMNRTYTKEEFYNLIDQTREIMPDVTITTDIIVGFPTETDQEFADTVEVVERVGFDSAFIFKYSERPNTRAAKHFKDDVSETDKTQRIIRLNDLQHEISLKKNLAQIGQIQDVMIDQLTTKKSNDYFQGRNDGNTIVILPKSHLYTIGDVIPVKIHSATKNALQGSPFNGHWVTEE
jgi:tRNA-2-methylthio-N6-dimethylallyladenosine synthase